MALPVSPNAISLGQVNTELSYTSTQSITLNDAVVRTLFAMSSGQIAMSDGHGKSAVSAALFPGITNYGVNDRTAPSTQYISISGAAASNSGSTTITYAAATGGGNIVYEWQFLPYARFNAECSAGLNTTPLVGSSQTFDGGAYDDSISGASTRSLTLTGYTYEGNSSSHSIAGYWRLKSSNSAGSTYTHWTHVIKEWDYYTYECNCVCNAGTYSEPCFCNCPQQCQGTENCNCTTGCTEVCSGCTCDCDIIYTCACTTDCDNPPDVHYPNGQCFGGCEGCPQTGTCHGCCSCQNQDCTTGCSQCPTCSCNEVCQTCTYCNAAQVCSTCNDYHYQDYGSGSGCSW